MTMVNVLGMQPTFQKTGLSGPFRIDDLYGVAYGRSGAYSEKLMAHDGKGWFLLGVTPSLHLVKRMGVKTLTTVPVVIRSTFNGEFLYLTAWSKSSISSGDTLLEDNQVLILTEHITQPVEDIGHVALIRFELNREFPFLHVITGKPGPNNHGLNITLNMEPFMEFAHTHH